MLGITVVVDGWLEVSEVAHHLGVSERRVRALLAGGQLPGVRRGGGWVIPAYAVADFARRPGGRPMAPDVARACLSMLSGVEPRGLSASHRARLRRRMVERLQPLGSSERADLLRGWCAARADAHRYWAFGPVLEELRNDGRLLVSGAAVAGDVDSESVEAYLSNAVLAQVQEAYRLRAAGSRKPNVVLHAVPKSDDLAVISEPAGHRVRDVVAGLDLMDQGDPRAMSEGRQIVARTIEGWLESAARGRFASV